jgi:hypothetical protein
MPRVTGLGIWTTCPLTMTESLSVKSSAFQTPPAFEARLPAAASRFFARPRALRFESRSEWQREMSWEMEEKSFSQAERFDSSSSKAFPTKAVVDSAAGGLECLAAAVLQARAQAGDEGLPDKGVLSAVVDQGGGFVHGGGVRGVPEFVPRLEELGAHHEKDAALLDELELVLEADEKLVGNELVSGGWVSRGEVFQPGLDALNQGGELVAGFVDGLEERLEEAVGEGGDFFQLLDVEVRELAAGTLQFHLGIGNCGVRTDGLLDEGGVHAGLLEREFPGLAGPGGRAAGLH